MILTVPHFIQFLRTEYHSWRPILILSMTAIISLTLEFTGSMLSTVDYASAPAVAGARAPATGLGVQLLTLITFVLCATLFVATLRNRRHEFDPRYVVSYTNTRAKWLKAAIISASASITLRTAYRLIQIVEGYRRPVTQVERLFLVIDAVAMLVATMSLAFIPVRASGQIRIESSTRRLASEPLGSICQSRGRLLIVQSGQIKSRMTDKPSTSATPSRRVDPYQYHPSRDTVDNDDLLRDVI
ncbi:hypothetical protein F5B22DRAFT_25586 [Xylaria bambusicola]|uniref:uncharacterized protein n=1 Tax=Xylaria bambusicola TaxID=326684 RepID=UPI002008B4A4|nr:uncharacterized protein F5B22DRAFT_25586 [Xylaria bambusicola]KAI0528185.1 hypothetical protein F5B22DRAFT_25586 [Xylaria bambusicola]